MKSLFAALVFISYHRIEVQYETVWKWWKKQRKSGIKNKEYQNNKWSKHIVHGCLDDKDGLGAYNKWGKKKIENQWRKTIQ